MFSHGGWAASYLRGAASPLVVWVDLLQDGVKQPEGRGNCVVFKTSAADAFVGQERDPSEYLDYIVLDVSTLDTPERQPLFFCVLLFTTQVFEMLRLTRPEKSDQKSCPKS